MEKNIGPGTCRLKQLGTKLKQFGLQFQKLVTVKFLLHVFHHFTLIYTFLSNADLIKKLSW